MGVDTQLAIDKLTYGFDGVRYLFRQTAAVGITENQPVGTSGSGGLHALERIFTVRAIGIEEMLGVIHDLFAVLLKVSDAVAYHGQIFFQRRLQYGGDMQRPRLSYDCHYTGVSVQKSLNVAVLSDVGADATGAAEGNNL